MDNLNKPPQPLNVDDPCSSNGISLGTPSTNVAAKLNGVGTPETTPTHGVGSPNQNQNGENLKKDKLISVGNDSNRIGNVDSLRTLHVENIPLECQYDNLTKCFDIYGNILEIRMNMNEKDEKWEAWITYDKHEAALKACSNISKQYICNALVRGALTDKAPGNLDSYKPSQWSANHTDINNTTPERRPSPPMWLVITVKEEKYNYYKFCRHLQKKVGGIGSGDISRFGKNRVLVHTKSKTQSYMLSLMNVEGDEMIRDIKPHLNFSYGRGVIFDRDLYDLEEHEILEMSPPSVWKVKKVPKANMVLLTFMNQDVPDYVIFENERVRVRPFNPKPLQCYNCYKFGHPSNVCRNSRICRNCSSPEHGPCSETIKCVNCNLCHIPTDKKCEEYNFEEVALLKANAEHVTVAYAKKLLGKHRSYAKVVKHRDLGNTKPSANQTVHPQVSDSQINMIESQDSRSNALPVGAEAKSSKPSETDSSSLEVTPPLSQPNEILSQASSLPDLMEVVPNNPQKRSRNTSDSPSPTRVKGPSPPRKKGDIPKYQDKNLKTNQPNSLQEKTTIADVHHPPDSQSKNKKSKTSKDKPSISRNSEDLTSKSRSHKAGNRR